MGSRIDTALVLNALLMALWRRQPKDTILVHSDQGSQFTGHDWQGFLRDHNLLSSMSRRGNCHDNAVAESFFQLLKRERIRRRFTQPGKMHGLMSSITSRCSTTQSAATAHRAASLR